MIDYRRGPSASEAAHLLSLPRTPDGRISVSHPRRPEIGTIVLGAGESVTLNPGGARTITDAAGNSRTVFARKQ